jgi:lipase
MLHTWSWGDEAGPAVVCLHGITGHGARFRKLAEERLRGFRVLAPDLRGHGRSLPEPPWTLEQHAEDVVETLAAHGVERAAFVGHSFGGRLVLHLPHDVVERAVLLDPALWLPPFVALDAAESGRREVSFASPEDAVADWLPKLFGAPPALVEEEVREHAAVGADGRFRYRVCRSAAVAGFGELSREPPPGPPPYPVLAVVSEESHVVDEERLPGAEIVRVPGGHHVLWDSFDATADAVARFLGG